MANPPTREVVADMTRDGYTPREIATMLGITTQTVYYHLGNLDLTAAARATIDRSARGRYAPRRAR